MPGPYDRIVGECVLCRRPAVEDVDALNIDGDLIHDECHEMEQGSADSVLGDEEKKRALRMEFSRLFFVALSEQIR